MGPLAGIKVLEIAGMMLADLGAEVILVERAAANKNAAEVGQNGFFNRGKQSIALDLKDPKAVESVLQLAEQSDVLIEGFRPGVMGY